MKHNTLIIIGIIAVISIAIFVFSLQNTSGLPSYALKNDKVKEAYMFAKDNLDALKGINCHCGCMKVPHGGEDRVHKDLSECFIQPDGNFEEHGANCNVCINDALMTKQLFNENKTKSEINELIGEIYS